MEYETIHIKVLKTCVAFEITIFFACVMSFQNLHEVALMPRLGWWWEALSLRCSVAMKKKEFSQYFYLISFHRLAY